MKILRPDQSVAIASLREAMRKTRRVVLQGPTGSGKTVLISDIVEKARQKNKKVLITVPAISLVDQTVIAVNAQGVSEIGVIQAAHPMTDWSKPVQVASIQTLQHRWREGKMPEADLVLVDEVHRWFQIFPDWMLSEQWLRVPFVGFSATPWTKGLGTLYENMVSASSIGELTSQKVLVPFRTFAPDSPDLAGVRVQGGDFVASDLEEVMRPKKLVANIVETWRMLADGRPTVAFCCSRAHADQLAKEFNEAGIGAGYLDCDSPLSVRQEVRSRMLRGEVKVVCNVDVIGLGVDWPEVSCIVYARPTMSDMRFVQNVGRGLRSAEGKDDLLILDHSTTTARLGFVDEIYTYHSGLDDGKTKAKKEVVLLPKECPACHLMKPPRVAKCPHCGHVTEAHAEPVKCERGTLREMVEPIDEMAVLRKRLPDRVHVFAQLVWWGRQKGYNQYWANMKFKEIYGVKFPRFDFEDKVGAPCPELLTYIYESQERWKRQQYAIRRGKERKANGNGRAHEEEDEGALGPRSQAAIDRAAEEAKGSLMTEQDWQDMGDFR